jgi:hypothetical protein
MCVCVHSTPRFLSSCLLLLLAGPDGFHLALTTPFPFSCCCLQGWVDLMEGHQSPMLSCEEMSFEDEEDDDFI